MANAEQLITDNLDVWVAAIKRKNTQGRGSSKKIELYGIKKLRELILELAVRGLLVPQDPNDEPASVLLKKIAVEKARLVKEGKIKKQKPLSPISDEGKPFVLPIGWEFARLESISDINGGFAFKSSSYIEDGVRVIRISDFDEKGFKNDRVVRYEYSDDLEQYLLFDKNILMAMTGGTVGKCLLVKEQAETMVVNQRVATIKLMPFLSPDYINCTLQTSTIQNVISEAKNSTNDNISMSDIKGFIIAFPSAAEQHRIVATVDELMALCDQLEQHTEASLSAHQTLVETLLGALTATDSQNTHPARGAASGGKADKAGATTHAASSTTRAADNARFTDAWQRIAAHFDTLFTTEHSIDQLKETILQLAVQGKLVPQDPNDEPASELLKKIAAEKARLIKDKKIKKPKKLKTISEDERFIELPVGWNFVRLNDLGEWGAGATPSRRSPELYGGDIPWFKSGELSRDYISESEEFVTEVALQKSSLRYNKAGDVLLAMYGATIGKTSILSVPATTNQAVCACTPFTGFKNTFLLMLLKAYKPRFISMGAGGAQPNISREKIIATVIALPPTKEQHRIVAKVDELMALCDSLKSRIKTAQSTQLHLSDAMAEQALN